MPPSALGTRRRTGGQVFAGLIRAVNLPGHQALKMDDLKAFLGEIGLTDARTLLASGNFVAKATVRDAAALERMLERESARRLKLSTEFFVRELEEWNSVVTGNPFPKEAAHDPGRLVVLFMKAAPERARVTALQSAIQGRETVRALGRHLVTYYPDGQGRSKLNASMIEKHLGLSGTARNWNTVLKLKAMLESE
jgi:uncharacterized protein (DUF1697 family)